jgi:GNAT superfamily N-acetyltransferase
VERSPAARYRHGRFASAVDRAGLLALYDREVRQHPFEGGGYHVDRQGPIVRLIGPSRAFVLYARPSAESAAAAVRSHVEEFRRRKVLLEWKVHGHDPGVGLPALLSAAGFVATEPEQLMVRDLNDAPIPAPAIPGLEVRPLRGEPEIDEVVEVDRAAFGHSDGSAREHALGRLADPTVGLFLARLDGTAVASGRVELPPGRSFAGLFGGGTDPRYRGRGIYRALVAARAQLARDRGFRYLMVEARESTSRPILERLGFQPLTRVVGWELPVEGASTP